VFIGLWVVGGMLALAGALSLAELAAAFPESGGYYAYLRESWGRAVAFLFGWTQLVLLRASAIGGIALACGQYTLRMLGVDPSAHPLLAQLVSASAIVIAASANIVGARIGAAIVNASSSAKFVALVGLAGVALFLGGAHGASTANFASTAPVTASGFGLALVSVLWAYDGFGDVSFAGGEVIRPDRTLPRAIIGGTMAVVVAYVLVNVGYVYVLSTPSVAKSPLVAADTMTAIVGPAGAALVSLLVAVSTFGALNADFLGSPRVFFAMADDGLFFRAVARVHPRFRHTARRHHADGSDVRDPRVQPQLRGTDRDVRHSDLAVLRPLRRRHLQVAAASPGPETSLSRGRLSDRAGGVPDRRRGVPAERADE
jgi:amino acid transporter